jgi:hypothetical protein
MNMRRWLLSIASLLVFPGIILCKEYATTESGKKVILYDDGTWEYATEIVEPQSFEYDFRKAKWGMSVEQVKNSETAHFESEGWCEELTSYTLEYTGRIADITCTIGYTFRNEKLEEAGYVFLGEEYGGTEKFLFEKFKKWLIEKYGEPIKDITPWLTWETTTTIIKLDIVTVKGRKIVGINYFDKRVEEKSPIDDL